MAQNIAGNHNRKTLRHDLENKKLITLLSIIIDPGKGDHFGCLAGCKNNRADAFHLSIIVAVRILKILIQHSRAARTKTVRHTHLQQGRFTQLEGHVNVLGLVNRLTRHIKRY